MKTFYLKHRLYVCMNIVLKQYVYIYIFFIIIIITVLNYYCNGAKGHS